MSIVKRLQSYRRYADRVLEASAEIVPQGSEQLAKLLASARRYAEQLKEEATTPVKIGVVGQFSAGKTYLIGALLGYADLLPVGEVPITGNVLALRFEALPKGATRPAELRELHARFMSREDFQECLLAVCADLLEILAKAGLPRDTHTPLAAARAQLSDNLEAGLAPLRAACGTLWKATHSLRLRYLIRELAWLVAAYEGSGGQLAGRVFSLPVELLAEATRLTLPAGDITEAALADTFPSAASQVSPGSQLDAEMLARFFPLVLRLEGTVTVPPEVWRLPQQAAGGASFVLYDFPGLGADSSGLRDRYLSERELRDIHSILVVLNARTPGDQRGLEFFDLLKERQGGASVADRILVAIGRFDQLPIEESERAALRDMTVEELPTLDDDDDASDIYGALQAPGSGGVSDAKVLETVESLRRVVTAAQGLAGRRDRVVFASPFLMTLAQLRAQRGFPAASAGEQAKVEGEAPRLDRAREQWREVIRALKVQGSLSLAEWLEGFVHDGGGQALRDLIQEHVDRHGLDQIHTGAARALARLVSVKHKLVAALEAANPTARDEGGSQLRAVSRALRGLYERYWSFRRRIADNPPRFKVTLDGRELFLDRFVEEEVEDRVMRWPQWQRLNDLVGEGERVGVAGGQAEADGIYGEVLAGLGRTREDATTSVPLSSKDLYPAFEELLLELFDVIGKKTRQAFEAWLRELEDELVEYTATLAQRLDRLDVNERARGPLRIAIMPTTLAAPVIERLNRDHAGHDERRQRIQHIYPLSQDLRFAWDKDLLEVCDEVQRDPAVYWRIRMQLIRSAKLELKETVSRVNERAVGLVSDLFKRVEQDLTNVLGDHQTLRRVAGLPASDVRRVDEATLRLRNVLEPADAAPDLAPTPQS